MNASKRLKDNYSGNPSRAKCAVLCHCEAFFKGRGNLNRYILDCFVVKLLAMTAQTQLIPRERLPILKDFVLELSG